MIVVRKLPVICVVDKCSAEYKHSIEALAALENFFFAKIFGYIRLQAEPSIL